MRAPLGSAIGRMRVKPAHSEDDDPFARAVERRHELSRHCLIVRARIVEMPSPESRMDLLWSHRSDRSADQRDRSFVVPGEPFRRLKLKLKSGIDATAIVPTSVVLAATARRGADGLFHRRLAYG